MRALTVVVPYRAGVFLEKTLSNFTDLEAVERIVIVAQEPVRFKSDKCHVLNADPLTSHGTLQGVLEATRTKYLLLLEGSRQVSITPQDLGSILNAADSKNAGLLYSDFFDERRGKKTIHPVNDYLPGSGRDDFDFGAMSLFAVPAVRNAVNNYGLRFGLRFAGLYDLRLKLSIDHPILHLSKPLYTAIGSQEPSFEAGEVHESPSEEKMFAYVDPGNIAPQKEMEAVFTEHLKRMGAYIAPDRLRKKERTPEPFQAEASVVIPVRNRRETVAGAVQSALSQETDFRFNVIVVDNHSDDGTTAVLSGMAGQHSRLRHLIPARTDLGIGGCWNEALDDRSCGRYVVQLDSDDLYSGSCALQKLVDMLREGDYAMVIGSYTLVNRNLEEIPPGTVDHREWTEDNGHNNALRIHGLGAPRAFDTALMRRFRFLNVSYGEDYAAGLRISREYKIGRIYESLYLCRRWPGNTDAGLSIEEASRKNAFKDQIRTDEIAARQRMNENS